MQSTIVFIVILGVLVFFHEWGHFIAAKLSGIRVEEFAFGFGPKLARLLRRGDTEYTVHAVPLGGFVKLTGMEPGEEHIQDGFQAQPIWKRAIVIFAGPLFSFILGVGVLLFVGVYWGFPNGKMLPRVGVVEPGTEAARIDLRACDWVREINGVKITSGAQMTELIHASPGRFVTLVIDRSGRKITKTGRPRWFISYVGVGWSFLKGGRAVVQGVDERSAAYKAGIRDEDVLHSINGRDIENGLEMVQAIKANGDRPVTLVVGHNGVRPVTLKPTVQWVEFAGVKWLFPGGVATRKQGAEPTPGLQEYDRLVGIDGNKINSGTDMVKAINDAGGRPVRLVVERGNKSVSVRVTAPYAPVRYGNYLAIGQLGFVQAPHLAKAGFRKSITNGFNMIAGYLSVLTDTLTHGSKIKKDIGGPVMIYRATQQSVALGASHVFWLLGSLSLGLAVINLIPVPAVLDGGHLLLLGSEAVRRKRWSRAQMQAMQAVGFAVVFVLIVLILASDITKIITGQASQ